VNHAFVGVVVDHRRGGSADSFGVVRLTCGDSSENFFDFRADGLALAEEP